MFGTITYGIKEGPQPLGVVTLQTQRGGEGGGEIRNKGGNEVDRETQGKERREKGEEMRKKAETLNLRLMVKQERVRI